MDRSRLRNSSNQPAGVPGFGGYVTPQKQSVPATQPTISAGSQPARPINNSPVRPTKPAQFHPQRAPQAPVRPSDSSLVGKTIKPQWQPPAEAEPSPSMEEIWYHDPSENFKKVTSNPSEKLFEPTSDSKLDRIKAWRAQQTVKKAAKILGEPVAASPHASATNDALKKQLATIDPKSPHYRRPDALAAPKAAPQTVNIQIQIPAVSLERLSLIKDAAYTVGTQIGQGKSKLASLWAKVPRRHYKTLVIGSIACAVVVTASVIGLQLKQTADTKAAELAAKQVTDKSVAAAAATSKPTFTPVEPKTDSATKPVSGYDGSRNTYSFKDEVAGNPVVVSQQPLPEKFKSATVAVAEVAESLGAKESTQTINGTAYIATDAKSNAQTIVFSKNDLLLFIQSPFKHTGAEWRQYIDQLGA